MGVFPKSVLNPSTTLIGGMNMDITLALVGGSINPLLSNPELIIHTLVWIESFSGRRIQS